MGSFICNADQQQTWWCKLEDHPQSYPHGVFLNWHRCSVTDTLEHAILDCLTVHNFWNQIQTYVDKITDGKLTFTAQVKLFEKVKRNNNPLTPRSYRLNWILKLPRWAINKSNFNYRTKKNLTYAPEELFTAMLRSHLRFQYKLSFQYVISV